MKKALIATALLVAACAETTPVPTQRTAVSSSQVNLAKAAITENFKDPRSAQFQRIVGYRVGDLDTIVCGEINAKNSLGGYVGFRRFYARLRGWRYC